MNTTAIIVNYYTSSFLQPLLEILNNDPAIHEIIVADNSAEYGLTDALKKFSKVRLMIFERNLGFATAVNRAVENCNPDWFLLINPDTLPDKEFLEKLIRGAEQSDALIAGPRFFWDDEKTYKFPPATGSSWWMQTAMEAATGFVLDAKLLSYYLDLSFDRFWKEEEPFFEPFLSGACLLIKNDKTFFRDGKIFDEKFFLYYEDTDLCVSALTLDKTAVCVPDAHVVHYWNQAPLQHKGEFMAESQKQFWLKHYSGMSYGSVTGKGFEEISTDLGTATHSPRFEIDSFQSSGNLSFELALNHLFIPYIQTEVKNPAFEIPEGVWQVMPRGLIFGRIRNSLKRTITKWKWIKQ